MSMNKNKVLLIFISLFLVVFTVNVYAEEVACNRWISSGKEVCESKTYQGYKCKWQNERPKCKQSEELADKEKENITACEQITDPDYCRESKIVGHECIWRQNACYDNTMVDDGSGETIIAGDKQDRENQESAGTQNNQKDVEYENATDPTIVGENFCGETSTKRVLSLVGDILIIVKIAVPLLIIIIGSFDLFKAVMGKDEKDLMKSIKSLGLRLLLGIFIFFIPTIVNYVIDLVGEISGGSSNNQCVTCVLEPSKCEVNN